MFNATTLMGSAHSFVYHRVAFGSVWLVIAAGLLALAWWRRWMMMAVVACVLILWAGWALQPWLCLDPPDLPGNASELNLLAWWRAASLACVFLLVVGVGCLVTLLQFRRL